MEGMHMDTCQCDRCFGHRAKQALADTPMTEIREPTVGEQVAAAVLQGIQNTWEKGDQALTSEISRAILAIPEIKEGQELREKRDRLVELDEDQSMALYPRLDALIQLADEASKAADNEDDYERWEILNFKASHLRQIVAEVGMALREIQSSHGGFRRVKVKG